MRRAPRPRSLSRHGVAARVMGVALVVIITYVLFSPSSSSSSSSSRTNTLLRPITTNHFEPDRSLAFPPVGPFPEVKVKVNQPTCRSLSWRYQLAGADPTLHAYATAHPAGAIELDLSTLDCELMVVAAGFERSGSTLQHNILIDAARALGVEIYETYWQSHLHMITYNLRQNKTFPDDGYDRYKGLRDLSEGEYTAFNTSSTPGRRRVLILKSHEYDEPLLRLCRHQLLYTTHRRLDKAIASWVKLEWAQSLSDAVHTMDASLVRVACWRRAKAEDWRYEEFSKQPLEWGTKALHKIGAALGMSKAHIEGVQARPDFVGNMTKWLKKDSQADLNQGFLATSSKNGGGLPEGWLTVLKQRYGHMGKEFFS